MKIIAFVFTFFIASNIFVFSQETESIAASEVVASSEVPVEDVAEAVATAEIAENSATVDSSTPKFDYLAEDYEFEFIEIPAAKRPKPISEEKITEAKNKD